MHNRLRLRYEIYETVIGLNGIDVSIDVRVDVVENLSCVSIFLKYKDGVAVLISRTENIKGHNPIVLTNQAISALKEAASETETNYSGRQIHIKPLFRLKLLKEYIMDIPHSTFQEFE